MKSANNEDMKGTCGAGGKQDVDYQARTIELLLDEQESPSGYCWMSFCDPHKRKGTQFLGAVIVKAPGMVHALTIATHLGINPGGEAQGVDFDDPVPDKWLNRLLTKADIAQFDAEMMEAAQDS